MVQAPSAIHSHVRLVLTKPHSTCDRAPSGQLIEPKRAIKCWTVLTHAEVLHLQARQMELKNALVMPVLLGRLLSTGFGSQISVFW